MNSLDKIIKVGMAELNLSASPGILKTTGLGSCVAVCLYDGISKVGGMAHIMLPSSKNSRHATTIIGKYSDTAINELISLIEQKGISRRKLNAKIAGGAQMFSFAGGSEIMKIGQRNIEAVKDDLKSHGINIISEDVGGNYGRTVVFDLSTGSLTINTISQGVKII